MADVAIDHERQNALEEARKSSSNDLHIHGNSGAPKSGTGDNNMQDSSSSSNHSDRLDAARSGGNDTAQEKKYDSEKTKEKTLSLNIFAMLAQIDVLKDMPYFAAMLAAILKEIFDLVLAATVVFPILFSILNCIFGIMMMQLAKFSETKVKVHSRFLIRIVIFIAGAIFDSIPGIDFLPISVATTLIVYVLTLSERAKARKE